MEKKSDNFSDPAKFFSFFRHKTWNRHLCYKSSFWQPAILCSIKFWRPKQSGHTSPTRCSGPERQSSSDCCCCYSCCCWRRCCCCCSYCNFAVIVVDVVVALPDGVAATAIAVVTSCCCCFWFWYSCCYISCLFYQKSWNQDTFIF